MKTTYFLLLLSAANLIANEPASEELAMLDPTIFSSQRLVQEDFTPHFQPKKKNPYATVGLAFLSPGLGHVYLGDLQTAAGLGGSAWTFVGLRYVEKNNNDFQAANGVLSFNTWCYNIYAAYRDVRIYNNQDGYKYKMPTESLLDLALAPFRWSVIKKPEVWGGVLGALIAGIGLHYLTENSAASAFGPRFPLLAFPVGIGEESLFRGFLQPCLSEWLTPAGGIAASSLAFGAIHIPNAEFMPKEERSGYYTYSIPFITAFGAYFGYLTYKNNSLKESVAVHAWYDFTLFMLSYAASEMVIGRPTFSISIPF